MWCIHFSFSIFFLYSNSVIEYTHTHTHIYIYIKDPFLHLMVFGKLFWMHNFGYKFIIHGLALFSIFFFLSYFFHLHTLTSIKWGLCIFTKFMELPLYSFSMKIKMLNMCFHSLYSNITFRILKMKNEYKFLNQTSFFFCFFF